MAMGDKIYYTLILNGPEDGTMVTIVTDSEEAYDTFKSQFSEHVVHDSNEEFLAR